MKRNRKDKGLYRCNASIDGVPTDCDGQRTYRSQRVDENFKEVISAMLSIMIHRVEISRNYEMNIQLAPGFEQFIDGLIELR